MKLLQIREKRMLLRKFRLEFSTYLTEFVTVIAKQREWVPLSMAIKQSATHARVSSVIVVALEQIEQVWLVFDRRSFVQARTISPRE